MKNHFVTLKKGKEKAIKNKHHWIFSGAIERLPKFENGDVLAVHSYSDEHLGYAYFNTSSSIIGRMINFDKTSFKDSIAQNIIKAITLRHHLFNENQTNTYRLINSEGDCLPGLIVDKYGDILVLQITTLGIEKLKPLIVEILASKLFPKSIREKSSAPSRKEEGLSSTCEQILHGSNIPEIEILENGLKFLVNFDHGQKTGFFLDQREMRKLIKEMAAGKKVLNCFAYTGGFSVYALSGQALQVDSVDTSEKAIELAKKNISINNLENANNQFYVENVFNFLKEHSLDYDLAILDPPAFAKKKTDIIQACRGYGELNRLAISRLPKNSFLLTCSCSYHIDEKLFQQVIFQAACDAKRNVKILKKQHLASDHSVNIFHPEGSYLKSLLLYIE